MTPDFRNSLARIDASLERLSQSQARIRLNLLRIELEGEDDWYEFLEDHPELLADEPYWPK